MNLSNYLNFFNYSKTYRWGFEFAFVSGCMSCGLSKILLFVELAKHVLCIYTIVADDVLLYVAYVRILTNWPVTRFWTCPACHAEQNFLRLPCCPQSDRHPEFVHKWTVCRDIYFKLPWYCPEIRRNLDFAQKLASNWLSHRFCPLNWPKPWSRPKKTMTLKFWKN